MQARHLDGNGRNNIVNNLAWGTAQENADDRVRDKATTELDCTSSPIVSVKYMGVQRTYDLEVEGPWHNFSAGGLVVHNSVNEMSLRYSEAPEEFYIPALEHVTLQSGTNKQGRDETLELSPEIRESVRALMRSRDEQAYADYQHLAGELGIARELARTVLPVSLYTQWIWKIDLHNLMHFLTLRLDKHAQVEIRLFAEAMASFVKAWVPMAWEAFTDYRLEAATFSRQERQVLASMLVGDGEATARAVGLNGRELDEFMAKLAKLRAL